MSTPELRTEVSCEQICHFTLAGCRAAKASADALFQGISSTSLESLDAVRTYEEELDRLDHQINENVTSLITRVSESEARELLACLKFVIELERIGDLLLNVVNRFRAVCSRIEAHDAGELAAMTSIVSIMLGNATEAFARREISRALAVLGDDAELDRLRNLLLVRHVENPERQPVRESFHVVFMAQTLERAGDHVKNLAEEVCHLVSGRSVRHILRQYDKPAEQAFLDRLRQNIAGKS